MHKKLIGHVRVFATREIQTDNNRIIIVIGV